MFKVMVCNGDECWVAKTCRTHKAAVKVAEKIKHTMLSAKEVWIEAASISSRIKGKDGLPLADR